MLEAPVPVIPSVPRHRSRGGAKLKALIWLAILAAGAYVLYKAVPVYIANYELQDKMQTEARFAVVNHKSAEQIRDAILREIQVRDIPAAREDIKVVSNERGVHISVDYTVTVDLRVYQWQLHFTPSADSQAL